MARPSSANIYTCAFGTDENPLSYSGEWVDWEYGEASSGYKLKAASGVARAHPIEPYSGVHWFASRATAAPGTADYYSSVILSSYGNRANDGIILVRAATAANDGYAYYSWSANATWIRKVVGGTWTTLTSSLGAKWSAGNRYTLSAEGTEIKVWMNDTLMGSYSPDSSVTGQDYGVLASVQSNIETVAQYDDWEMGDLVAGGGYIAAMATYYRRLRG